MGDWLLGRLGVLRLMLSGHLPYKGSMRCLHDGMPVEVLLSYSTASGGDSAGNTDNEEMDDWLN